MLNQQTVRGPVATPAQQNLQQTLTLQVGYQLLFVMVAGLLLRLLSGQHIAESAFCGALAFALPANLCGWWLLRDRCIHPGFSLLRMYLVQLVKLISSVLLLCGAIFYLQLAILPILGAYFVMMLVTGLTAVLQRSAVRRQPSDRSASGLHA